MMKSRPNEFKNNNGIKKQIKIRNIRKVLIIVSSKTEKVKISYKRRTMICKVHTEADVDEIANKLRDKYPMVKEVVIRYETGHGIEKGKG